MRYLQFIKNYNIVLSSRREASMLYVSTTINPYDGRRKDLDYERRLD